MPLVTKALLSVLSVPWLDWQASIGHHRQVRHLSEPLCSQGRFGDLRESTRMWVLGVEGCVCVCAGEVV